MNLRAYAFLDETKVHASSRSACVPQRWAFSQNELFSTSEMKEYVKACVSDMASSMSFVWACVFVCVCVSLTCSREKKHPKKQQRWWSHFVMSRWGNFNTNWLKYLPNILREDTSANVTHEVCSKHQSLCYQYHLLFFNIIQHLIQIPYSWEDGWMDGWNPLIIKHNIDFEFATCITSSAPLKCLCIVWSECQLIADTMYRSSILCWVSTNHFSTNWHLTELIK